MTNRSWTARAGVSAAAVVCSIALPGLSHAQPVPSGTEFQAHTYTTGNQNQESVAMNASGSFVVVWASAGQDGSGSGIFGQRFTSTGARVGTEFRANTTTANNQFLPSVSMASSGAFVVVWESGGQDGSNYAVIGRRYDSAGNPIGGEFQVNTYTTGNQYLPSVVMASSGSFAMAWASPQDGSGQAIVARRYDSAGTALGAEFLVNTYTTSYQGSPKLAMDGSGNFVVVWNSFRDGSYDAVAARRYNSAGTALGSEFQINTYTTNYQAFPRVALDGIGNFVVAWFTPQDGAGYGVFGRRYNSAGSALGSEFQLNSFTPSDQSYPSVSRQTSGNFVVTWSSYLQDGSGSGIFGRRYDSSGVPLGPEFRANTTTANRQAGSVLAGDGASRLVAIWRSTSQDGSGDGVFGQLFCLPAGASCDDSNSCTDDSCDLATGCVHTPNTAACNDGNACTTNDTCSGGTCVGGAPLACNDGNVCTDDSCSPTLGCLHDPNGAHCDDGSACTIDDVCKGGVCSGVPVSYITASEGDGVSLVVQKGPGPGTVRLDWTGGQIPYRVTRSSDPKAVLDAASELGRTSATTWSDATPAGPAIFFYQSTPQSLLEPPVRAPAEPCDCYPRDADPARGAKDVNLFSGEFHHEAVDLRIAGRGLDFVWARRYRSRIGPFTALGNGWDYSYNLRVVTSGANRIVLDGNTRADTYVLQPDGTWTRRELFRVLSRLVDNSYRLTFADTGQWNFRPLDGSPSAGRIASIVDRNGNALTFAYDGTGRLVTVTDTLGRNVTIGYDANNRIQNVTDFTGRQIVYAYYTALDTGGAVGDLKSARTPVVTGTPTGNNFPSGKTTTYTYTRGFLDDRLNHNLLTITSPRGLMWLVNTYASTTDPLDPLFDHLTRQLWGDSANHIDVVYVPQTPSVANGFAVVKAIVNDRMGNVREYSHDFRNRLVISRDYTGRASPDAATTEAANRPTGKLRPDDPDWFETRFEYNLDSKLMRVLRPNGNSVRRVHEADLDPCAPVRSRGNLREIHRDPGPLGGDQSEIVELLEYDLGMGGCCGTNSVTRHVDGRGNETLHTYDTHGNRLHTQHRIATTVEDFEYNAFGQMTAHVLPDNGSGHRRRDTTSYYASGPQRGYAFQTIEDAGGLNLATTYEYNTVGKVVRKIDPRGHDTLNDRNALDEVVRTTSAEVVTGSGIRYRKDMIYDADGNITRLDMLNLDEQGAPQPNTVFSTSVFYDLLNAPVTRFEEVDPAHFVESDYIYDANHHLTLTLYGEVAAGHDPANVLRDLRDERDLPFRQTRGEGSVSASSNQVDYDGNGNPRALRKGLESSQRVTTLRYDGFDRLTSRTDAMGNVTEYHYDANGNQGGDRAPDVPNPFGRRVIGELIDVPGSAGNVRLAEINSRYDNLDRLIRIDEAYFDAQTQAAIGDGLATTQWTYTPNSQISTIVDDNGHQTSMTYDGANRRSALTDPRGNTTTTVYDPNSNVTGVLEVDLPDVGGPPEVFSSSYVFDNLDRMVQVTDSLGHVRSEAYDSRDNLVLRTDARGNTTRFAYDGLRRLVQIVSALTSTGEGGGPVVGDVTIQQTWDDSSRLRTRTDDNGNTTTLTYDPLDRVVARGYADGTGVAFAYDPHDKLANRSDANGNVFGFTYDLNDRMTGRTVVPGPGVSSATTFQLFQRDGLSRLVRAQDDDSLLLLSYNSLGFITQESEQVVPGGLLRTTTSTYDGVGNRTRLVYPGGRTIVSTYDPDDRRVLVRDDPPGPGTTIGTYAYLGPRRVQRLDYGNGVRFDYFYDGDRRTLGTRHTRLSGGVVLDDRTYGWDAEDNKNSLSATTSLLVDNRYWGYDSVDQLIHSSSSSGPTIDYQLDGAGNRTFTTGPDFGSYYMDPTLPEPADFQRNHYTLTPWGSRQYDRNGNLKQDGALQYVYDALDQLVSFTNTNTGQTSTYRYDPARRRVEKNVAGTITRLRHSAWDEIEEESSSGTSLATFVFGEGIDALLQQKRAGVARFHHADDLGSTIMVTDAAASVVERYAYGDFGTPQFLDPAGNPIPSSTIGNATLFTGRRFDPESGLIDYRERYQEPRGGRPLTDEEREEYCRRELHSNAAAFEAPLSLPMPTGTKFRCLVSVNRARQRVMPCRTLDCAVPCQYRLHHDRWWLLPGPLILLDELEYDTCECHDSWLGPGRSKNPEGEDTLSDPSNQWEEYKKACHDADDQEIRDAVKKLGVPLCGTSLR